MKKNYSIHRLVGKRRKPIDRKHATKRAHQSLIHGTTNRQFAQEDELFNAACLLAEVEPTKRQASKWRNKTGAAFSKRQDALENAK